jgi:hypothetical protein
LGIDQDEDTEQPAPSGEPAVSVNSRSTDEEMEIFKALVAERQAKKDRLEAIDGGEYDDSPFEIYLVNFINRLFREALWIVLVHQFPNGKPMLQQSATRVTLWEMLVPVARAMLDGYEPKDSTGGDRIGRGGASVRGRH